MYTDKKRNIDIPKKLMTDNIVEDITTYRKGPCRWTGWKQVAKDGMKLRSLHGYIWQFLHTGNQRWQKCDAYRDH
jgi:hypothetical protein